MKTAAILVAATQCFAAADHALWAASFFAVYRSDKEEDAFRRDWFLDCIDSRR